MQLTINGEAREVRDGSTLSQLLFDLQIRPMRVVVEHNRNIVAREAYDSTKLAEGDVLEIVHFVGGG